MHHSFTEKCSMNEIFIFILFFLLSFYLVFGHWFSTGNDYQIINRKLTKRIRNIVKLKEHFNLVRKNIRRKEYIFI